MPGLDQKWQPLDEGRLAKPRVLLGADGSKTSFLRSVRIGKEDGQGHSRRNILTRSDVHVATPHPKKSVSSVQIVHPRASAAASMGR